MIFNKHNPLSLKSWKFLESNFRKNAKKKISDYFLEDSDRVKKLSLQWESFYVDYSKNLLDQETLDLLLAVAEESGLNQAISDYFEGKKIKKEESIGRRFYQAVMFRQVECDQEEDKMEEDCIISND